MQNKSDRDLEDLAREYTLAPLGMTSTSYTSPALLQPQLTNGHVQASYPVVRVLAPAVFLFAAMMAVMVVLLRIWKKKWACPPVMWILAAIGATTVALVGLWYVYHWNVPKMGRLMAIAGLSFEALLAALLFIGYTFRKHLPPVWQTSPRRQIVYIGYFMLCMILLLGLFSLTTIPTPQKPDPFPQRSRINVGQRT